MSHAFKVELSLPTDIFKVLLSDLLLVSQYPHTILHLLVLVISHLYS